MSADITVSTSGFSPAIYPSASTYVASGQFITLFNSDSSDVVFRATEGLFYVGACGVTNTDDTLFVVHAGDALTLYVAASASELTAYGLWFVIVGGAYTPPYTEATALSGGGGGGVPRTCDGTINVGTK